MSRVNLSSSVTNRLNKLNIDSVNSPDDGNSNTNAESNQSNNVIELNVGGVYYATTMGTLLSEPDSLFVQLFTTLESTNFKIKDSKNKLFFDRDGILFRYVLDFLRNKAIILPENFNERKRLKREAEYFKLQKMVKAIDENDNEPQTSANLYLRHLQQNYGVDPEKEKTSLSLSGGLRDKSKRGACGYVLIGYRGTFAFGRESLSDVKFRKISRILVCGRVQLCREVFGDTLNESRDPDHGVPDRYTSRFYLKHTFLEQAFDTLNEAGFHLIGTCATGTNSPSDQFNKAANDSEESRWLHYNEFIFFRS